MLRIGGLTLFLAGAALYLWYLGSLRTWLHDAEGGTGRLSTVAFGAGTVWVGVNMVAQAFQIGLATDPRRNPGRRVPQREPGHGRLPRPGRLRGAAARLGQPYP